MAVTASAYDVATRAGVSIGTVSRYLTGNGYVGQRSRSQIAAAIADLGFVRSNAASSLRTRKTGLIGFVVSDLRNPFTAEVAAFMQEHARAEGYGVLLANSMGQARRALESVQLLRGHDVDGLVITPPDDDPLITALVELRSSGVPVVGLGLRTKPRVIDLVTADTCDGARQITKHLLELGHRRIAYLGSDRAGGRYRGYRLALRRAGESVDRQLVRTGVTDQAAGWLATSEVLSLPDPPTAIFGFNDAIALAVIQRATAHGLSVPRDLSVVGFDDVDLAQHSVPRLTTVAQPRDELARVAVAEVFRQLTDTIGEPKVTTLATQLVLRDSTAPPNRRAPSSGQTLKQ